MLRTTKLMKDKYEKIQRYLFSMIPEKWEEIYLYASVDQTKTGELYFYYLPKGLLKKKPVNVYEIPQKFNINEDEYLNIVKELFNCIKELHQDFIDSEQDVWSNLTISIKSFKFKVEYFYDNLSESEKEREENRIIWRYKYLKIGGDRKEERKILEDYLQKEDKIKHKTETYEVGLYIKTGNNEVSFEKEESDTEFKEKEKKVYNINPDFRKEKNKINDKIIEEEKPRNKNQILNM